MDQYSNPGLLFYELTCFRLRHPDQLREKFKLGLVLRLGDTVGREQQGKEMDTRVRIKGKG